MQPEKTPKGKNKKPPNADLVLLLFALLGIVVLGAKLLKRTRLDGLLDGLDVLLKLLVALDILRALAQRVQGAEEPCLLHRASEAKNVLSGADL